MHGCGFCSWTVPSNAHTRCQEAALLCILPILQMRRLRRRKASPQPVRGQAGGPAPCPARTLRGADPTPGANTVPCLLCSLAFRPLPLLRLLLVHRGNALQGLPFPAFPSISGNARWGASSGPSGRSLQPRPLRPSAPAPSAPAPSAPVTLRTPACPGAGAPQPHRSGC